MVYYHHPLCPTLSLLELAVLILDIGLEYPRLLFWVDFNYDKVGDDTPAQDVSAIMTALGLSQVV